MFNGYQGNLALPLALQGKCFFPTPEQQSHLAASSIPLFVSFIWKRDGCRKLCGTRSFFSFWRKRPRSPCVLFCRNSDGLPRTVRQSVSWSNTAGSGKLGTMGTWDAWKLSHCWENLGLWQDIERDFKSALTLEWRELRWTSEVYICFYANDPFKQNILKCLVIFVREKQE